MGRVCQVSAREARLGKPMERSAVFPAIIVTCVQSKPSFREHQNALVHLEDEGCQPHRGATTIRSLRSLGRPGSATVRSAQIVALERAQPGFNYCGASWVSRRIVAGSLKQLGGVVVEWRWQRSQQKRRSLITGAAPNLSSSQLVVRGMTITKLQDAVNQPLVVVCTLIP